MYNTSCPVVFGYVKIYTLSDKDGNVFYVGATARSVSERLKNHVSEAKSQNRTFVNVKKIEKIKSLNYEIVATVVDCVFTSARIRCRLVAMRQELELKWINTYLDLGYSLVNKLSAKSRKAVIKPDPIGYSISSKTLMG